MAWQDTVRTQIRVLLNDIDTPQTYSDATLDSLSLLAAGCVIQEINFTTNYTIDYSTELVTPDPSSDSDFLTFVAIKAACLKSNWDFNTRVSTDGVMAKLGPVSIDVGGPGASVLIALLKEGYCKMYQTLADKHNSGQTSTVRAIMSPFSHDDLRLY